MGFIIILPQTSLIYEKEYRDSSSITTIEDTTRALTEKSRGSFFLPQHEE